MVDSAVRNFRNSCPDAGVAMANIRIGKNHGYLRRLCRAIRSINPGTDAQALTSQDG